MKKRIAMAVLVASMLGAFAHEVQAVPVSCGQIWGEFKRWFC